jgi:hypothetical protein
MELHIKNGESYKKLANAISVKTDYSPMKCLHLADSVNVELGINDYKLVYPASVKPDFFKAEVKKCLAGDMVFNVLEIHE